MTDQERKAIDAIVAEEMQMPPDRVQLSQPAVFISPTELAYLRACEEFAVATMETNEASDNFAGGFGDIEKVWRWDALRKAALERLPMYRAAWDAERGQR